MAIPEVNHRNWFQRAGDYARTTYNGVVEAVQNRPDAQTLAAGSAMLLFNTTVITAAKLIPNPTSRLLATVLPPILLFLGGEKIGRNRGMQLGKTALGLGCITG